MRNPAMEARREETRKIAIIAVMRSPS